ncbi:hypothetical protein ABZW18_32285 [Streptomyces sp. NPDC004647]|uniref:hypothetical protein n=1 Tax=Streptomyces sp. NPDC004647 TaxID=3154671 RepID=UPI0033A1875E
MDEYLTVPGHCEVFACGDAAAVPDPARPGELTPMTAQHAVRQGRTAAHNIAASCGHGDRSPYRYREPASHRGPGRYSGELRRYACDIVPEVAATGTTRHRRA